MLFLVLDYTLFKIALHINHSRFCLILLQAARTFLSFDGDKLDKKEVDINGNSTSFAHHYLNKAISILSCNISDGECFLMLVVLVFTLGRVPYLSIPPL